MKKDASTVTPHAYTTAQPKQPMHNNSLFLLGMHALWVTKACAYEGMPISLCSWHVSQLFYTAT